VSKVAAGIQDGVGMQAACDGAGRKQATVCLIAFNGENVIRFAGSGESEVCTGL